MKGTGMEWKDATNYAQGERGVREPSAFEVSFGNVKVYITTGHIHYRGEWIMHCRALHIDTHPLGLHADATKEEAGNKALSLAKHQAERIMENLDKIIEELE